MLTKRYLFTLALTTLLALALFGCGSQSDEPEAAPRTLEYFKPIREAPDRVEPAGAGRPGRVAPFPANRRPSSYVRTGRG